VPARKSSNNKTDKKSVISKAASDGRELVVVGSSAGGVTALSVLVNTIHKDFPAPIVLAQHLDPQRASHLGTILERRSKLPIVTVGEGRTPLEGGKVYVVPANRHVSIKDTHLQLDKDSEERPIPSVDRLLSSASKAYGEHLIAVILTGSGSDGAAGAVAVKEAGGVVIIQNPQTAPYPSMPLSLPPTVVDHVVEIEEIGPLLSDLVTGVLIPEKVDDPLRDLLTYITRQTNMDFRNYKPSTILRRLSRRMAIVHATTPRDYDEYVHGHPEEVSELVKAFLINVTGFFRDKEAFEFLRDSVIPQLIEKGRENGRVLRFWSAGCSTGEEAYSLGILLADILGPELTEWNVKIFATDIDDEAVSFARRGIYPAKLLADLPDGYRERFFERIDHGFRIAKPLRQMVIFGTQDLSRGIPFPRMDLVVCRNLLIYLKQELQQDVLDLFAYSLHQTTGYLFLGKAETARPTKATFELVNKKWKIYRCTSAPLALPSQKHSGRARAEWRLVTRRLERTEETSLGEMTQPDLEMPLRRMNEVIFRYLPIGIVIIDRSYHIVTINPAARKLLGIREVAIAQDFLHTVRGVPYVVVREAIDSAFREHSTITHSEVELDNENGGTGRFINMSVMPAHSDGGSPELAIITIIDANEAVLTKRRLEAMQEEQARTLGELGGTNSRLGSMNKELQETNEELQTANEELMLTQEELQATNEEFEATNEELQATNEELETNNEELQATNEELQTTNDELTARTTELQELARQVSETENKLRVSVERFPFYVMVVRGPNLVVESYSARYALLFGDRDPREKPIEEVLSGDDVPEFVQLVKDCFQSGTTHTAKRMSAHVTDHEGQGSEFIHTLVPIYNAEKKVDGVIIYTENVTETRVGRRMKSAI